MEASNAHLDPRFHSFGPYKDTATVKINVLDVDEPPVFTKPSYTMDVYEDTPAGTIIGAVTAQDLDAGSSPVRQVSEFHIAITPTQVRYECRRKNVHLGMSASLFKNVFLCRPRCCFYFHFSISALKLK